ncbi:hypothetical protein EV1_005706 [Malus domestica]
MTTLSEEVKMEFRVSKVPMLVVVVWNCVWRRKWLLGFVRRYPDAELRGAIDGQYDKVTGVVTCGSIPLESSYQRVPRDLSGEMTCLAYEVATSTAALAAATLHNARASTTPSGARASSEYTHHH